MGNSNFFDGDIQAEVNFPSEGFSSSHEKREWGKRVLGEFASKIHGRKYLNSVVDNCNRFGRLTGTKISISEGEKVITYALIEPKQDKGKVLISKVESDSTEGSIFDVMDYKFQERASDDVPDSPLAAALKKAGVEQKVNELPSVEIITVRINLHPKNGKPAIAPEYLAEDPITGGKSMRLFHGTPPEGYRLQLGQKWRAQIEKTPHVGKLNQVGIPMVHVNVKLLTMI